jgi:predicted dehydrogenase
VAPVKLGIVGCGFVAEHRHLPTLRRLPEIHVEAVADADRDRCERVAARFGVPYRYDSVHALLERPEVEAVAVCTPASAHAEVAGAALEAGKHVFVEKPLTLSLEEADALVERARRQSSATAMVGFNLRWHRLVRQAQALLRQGSIGRVTAVVTTLTDARSTVPGLPAWRRQRHLGGGSLLEKLVHHFDLWRFLLDDEADEVFALTRGGQGEDEVTMVTGRMRGGTLVHALASDLTSSSNHVDLYGEEGALGLDLYRFDGLERSMLHDLPGAPVTRVRRVLASAAQLAAGLGEIRHGGLFDATYGAEWRHFAGAVRTSRQADCTFEDGRRALQIALAAAASASVGRPISVAQAPPTVTAASERPAGEVLA